MMTIITPLLFLLVVYIIYIYLTQSFYVQRKRFNNGICPKCGSKMKLFEFDENGDRTYCCPQCRKYKAKVKYRLIDNF